MAEPRTGDSGARVADGDTMTAIRLADGELRPARVPRPTAGDRDLRVAAVELLIEAKLDLDRHAEVVPQLETLIREHPYREHLRGS